MNKFIVLLFCLFTTALVSAQISGEKKVIKVPPPVCYASGKVERAAIPPPPEIINALKSTGEKKSNIIVTYNSAFPEDAKQAFEYAVGIWEEIIESTVPIYVKANWSSLSADVLGSCGPDAYYSNFENAPHKNIYYPVALVEKLTKSEMTGPSTPDINASFNKNIDWYFNTDLETPDTLYDFATVVLHEMAHGLGFTGFFFVDDDEGAYGYTNYGDASAFDLLVVKGNGDRLLDTTKFENQSLELKKALVSNGLYNSSSVALTDAGIKPRLYAPPVWDDGSSVYHLNDATYPSTNPNSLMTHAIGKAEAVHDPGPLTNGIMADLGWKHLYIDFDELKDIETMQPLVFNVNLTSEFDLDSSALYVVYSTDNFQNEIDTLNLTAGATETLFEAELVPSLQTGVIQYYISAGDVKNRTFRLPTEAPEKYYSITIGPDTVKPEITHNPISFFLLNGDGLKISANIDDNIGVDSVFVLYSINNEEQTSFALHKETGDLYSGYFNFNLSLLNDGDTVKYSITAVDASSQKNTATSPLNENYSFTVEEIYGPVAKYINNFDVTSTDFVLSDFDIFEPLSFENGALNSPHPYPSPEKDDTEYNLISILKYPVILKEEGTMTFDEVVLVEPGESLSDFGDADFWDYVIVEGSKDNGKTWLPLVDGYDSRSSSKWLTKYNSSIVNNNSRAVGSSDLYVSREINLLENGNFSAEDTILIRFRLYSDPFAHGWGWAIDNLRIQLPVSSLLTTLSPGNIGVYPNPFNSELNVTIDTKNTADDVQADIFNIYGQKIKSVRFENISGIVTQKISLDGLSDGIYLLNISENGKKVYTQKLIKNSN